MTTVGRREEGDGANRRAPHGGDVREKASLPVCARSMRIRLSENTPTRLGPSGPSRAEACGVERAGTGRGWPDGPKSEENSLLNKN
jgi:hypothetical protein